MKSKIALIVSVVLIVGLGIRFIITPQWDGEVNGRHFNLETPCLSGHYQTTLMMQVIPNGKFTTTHLVPITTYHCDCYGVTDTIWEAKTK
jgi:hypothetical protein